MPTVYNAANIQAWNAEILALKSQIQQERLVVAEHNQALNPLQAALQITQGKIQTVQAQLSVYELRNAQDQSYHWHQAHHHHHGHPEHPHYHSSFLHTVSDIFSAFELARLRNELSDQQNEARRIEGKIRPYLEQITQHLNLINQAEQRLSWLNLHSNNGQAFLHKLKTKPDELVKPLKRKLSQSFHDYDDKHLEGLSAQVRICLLSLKDRLAYLSPAPEEAARHELQKNYLQVYALIQDMQSKVEREGQDPQFNQLLKSLIEESHLGEDLPDELATQQSMAEHYQSLIQQNQSLFALSETELTQLEQSQYQQLQKQLQATHPANKSLATKITNAAKSLDEMLSTQQKAGLAIDYRFYNLILIDLNKIASNSQDNKALNHLNKLTNLAAGKPNVSKQLVGALITVLALALIAASIGCLVATFGGSSFASSFGMALGLSLLQSKITLGLSASFASLAGIGMTIWGLGKCQDGQRQGLSKELSAICEEGLHPSLN